MEMKNVISAIENEGKYIKINIEIIGIKKRIHIIQYNIALLYYVKEKKCIILSDNETLLVRAAKKEVELIYECRKIN